MQDQMEEATRQLSEKQTAAVTQLHETVTKQVTKSDLTFSSVHQQLEELHQNTEQLLARSQRADARCNVVEERLAETQRKMQKLTVQVSSALSHTRVWSVGPASLCASCTHSCVRV